MAELSHISATKPNRLAPVLLIIDDKELRHPHIKILNYLSDQFDMQTGKFEEVNFSKIVKECRVGNNKAKGYLDLLVEKGLIKSMSEGHRKNAIISGQFERFT
jgi:hypothetical protein